MGGEEAMFAVLQRLASASGASLAFHHQAARRPARGILLINHGLAEHARRYQRFALDMSTRGYHVYAHDHRGHGETTAIDAPIGRFATRQGVEKVLTDVVAMRDHATSCHPDLPVILFGHSMGGLISLNAAVTAPQKFDGIAVWNSNFHPGLAGRLAQLVLRAERMFKGSDVPSAVLPRLTFDTWGKSIPGHRTLADWLSHDPAVVDAYLNDPLCGFDISVSMWMDVFSMTFRAPQHIWLDRLPKSMPIHLLGGSDDPATGGGREIVWLSNHLKKAGFSHISTTISKGMRHETLNEAGSAAIVSDFSAWCDRIAPAPSSEG